MKASARSLGYIAGLAASAIIVAIAAVVISSGTTTEAPRASRSTPTTAPVQESSPVGTWSGQHMYAWVTDEPYRETVRVRLNPCESGGDDCGVVTWLDEEGRTECVMAIRYLGIDQGKFMYMGNIDTEHSRSYCEAQKVSLREVGGGKMRFEQIHQLYGAVYEMTLRPEA